MDSRLSETEAASEGSNVWGDVVNYTPSAPSLPLVLRDYQRDAVDVAIDALDEGKVNPCIEIPTGGGKSWIIAALANHYHRKRVIVLQHRKELIRQNHEKLVALGIDAGILSAGLGRFDVESNILVAGIQTACRRRLGQFSLIIIDEAHRIPFEGDGQYRSFIQSNPDARVLGLTATPYRLDGGSVCGPHYVLNEIIYNSIFKFLALDISDYRIISGLAERVRSPCLSTSVALEL